MEECPHRGAASVDFVIVNRSIIRVRGAPETSGSTGLLSPDESRPHPFPSTGHAPHMKEWCEPRGSHGINTRPEPPTWVLPGLADVANALYLERSYVGYPTHFRLSTRSIPKTICSGTDTFMVSPPPAAQSKSAATCCHVDLARTSLGR